MSENEIKKEKSKNRTFYFKNKMAALRPRCTDRDIKSASAIIQLGVIALVVWGIIYGINELEEWSHNEELRRTEIEASKNPEQKEKEALLAEYDQLKSGAAWRASSIAEAEWWLERKRLRYEQARAPGSGQDLSVAQVDYEEATAKLAKLIGDK